MSIDCSYGKRFEETARRRVMASLFAAALVLLTSLAASGQNVPSSSHVILVVEENRSYSTVTTPTINGQPNPNYMPWLVGKGNAFGHATNYNTNSNGSLLDYLWLSSGSCESNHYLGADCTLPKGTNDFQCTGGGCNIPITDNNIFKELD